MDFGKKMRWQSRNEILADYQSYAQQKAFKLNEMMRMAPGQKQTEDEWENGREWERERAE